MKKSIIIMVLCMVVMGLCACSKETETVNQATPDPTVEVEVTPEPTIEPTIEPTVEPTPEPTVEPTVEPTPEPTLKPTPKPTAKPTPEPVVEQVPEPVQPQQSQSGTPVVVIDAGHQAKQNSELEPIGPGAFQSKPKVSSGTQGRFTGVPEYQVNLEVSLQLKTYLESLGYQVIMVRTTNNVNISNRERAEIANAANADVFVRIHCNGADNASVSGALTISPTANNPYCSNIYKQSKSLSSKVVNSISEVTGAKNKGVMETDTMSGINWCSVPVTIVEMGYMTNENDDRNLVNGDYQKLMVQGIGQGIKNYIDSMN